MRMLAIVIWLGLSFGLSSGAYAGFSLAPYASIKSTKTKKKSKTDPSKEEEVIKQRNETGIRGALGLGRLFKLQVSVGQSKLTTTQKTNEVKDEYGEIDFAEDANMDTSNPLNELKTIETQNNGKATLIFDPSFWIFFLRARAGITVRQRIVDNQQTVFDDAGTATTNSNTVVVGPKYGAHSGVGLGINLGTKIYAVAEYGFEHYKFPEVEPFERELTVSFGVSI